MRRALGLGDKVLVVVGSAHRSRDTRNPFTCDERIQMIRSTLSPEDNARVEFIPVRDYYDNVRWAQTVQLEVERRTSRTDNIKLVGHKKDITSAYLDMFPGWHLAELDKTGDIDATALRSVFFCPNSKESRDAVLKNYVSSNVLDFLNVWSLYLPVYNKLVAEYQALTVYRQKWTAPFSLAADAVVTAQDCVLLIKRGGDIGTGQWALPGGFVEPGEQFYPAAIRELKEETGLSLLPSTMRMALCNQAVFDHALRSPRGRIVTTAFHFDLKDMLLPEVRAADDAEEGSATWIPINQLLAMTPELFEDHASILDHFFHILP